MTLLPETSAAPDRIFRAIAWIAAVLLFTLVLGHTVAVQRIALGLLVIGFSIHCLRARSCAFPLRYPIVAWIGLGAASILWSVAPESTIDQLTDEAIFPLLLFVVFYAIGARPDHDKRIVGSVLAGIAALSLLSLGGFDTLILDEDEGRSGWLRYYPGVGQASTYAVLAIPLFVLACRNRQRHFQVAAVLGLAGCFAVGIVSANRMFWPAAAAAVLFSGFGLNTRWKPRHLVASGLLAAAFAVATVAGVQYYRFESLTAAQGGAAKKSDTPALLMLDEVRPKLWHTWFHKALEHPWLGIGFGQEVARNYYRPRAPKDPVLSSRFAGHHAHNLFLNAMLQTGLVGVAILLWLLGALGWRYLRSRVHQRAAAWAGIGLLAAMILKNSTDDFMRDAVAMYFWSLAGWLLACAERPAPGTASPP